MSLLFIGIPEALVSYQLIHVRSIKLKLVRPWAKLRAQN